MGTKHLEEITVTCVYNTVTKKHFKNKVVCLNVILVFSLGLPTHYNKHIEAHSSNQHSCGNKICTTKIISAYNTSMAIITKDIQELLYGQN